MINESMILACLIIIQLFMLVVWRLSALEPLSVIEVTQKLSCIELVICACFQNFFFQCHVRPLVQWSSAEMHKTLTHIRINKECRFGADTDDDGRGDGSGVGWKDGRKENERPCTDDV